MSDCLTDIVAVSDRPGVSRWHAVAPSGSVVGSASLRPDLPFPSSVPSVPELRLYVEPEQRRRGIGSRLLTAVQERATETRLATDVAPDSPGESFCLRHGFRNPRIRRHDLLTYCDVHQAWLGELVDAEHPGYRLTHWTGDLPSTAGAEALLRGPSRPGNAVLTAADMDGDLAAYVVAVVGGQLQPRARQYGPTVFPEHRGRRLGRWVNAALIRRLREVHPHVSEIETATAGDGRHSVGTLEDLGFRLLRRMRRYELTL
ncbi:GNAT family N-acetyltransferase [Cryptosporangium minutisporangium]